MFCQTPPWPLEGLLGLSWSRQDALREHLRAFRSLPAAPPMLPRRLYRLQVASKSSRMPSAPFLGAQKTITKHRTKTIKIIGKQRNSTSRPHAAKSCQDASKTAWGALHMAPTWPSGLPGRLHGGLGSVQDASYTPPGPPQELPRRLPDSPQSAQEASKTLQRPPRRLWERPRNLQEASETPPRALQRRLPS